MYLLLCFIVAHRFASRRLLDGGKPCRRGGGGRDGRVAAAVAARMGKLREVVERHLVPVPPVLGSHSAALAVVWTVCCLVGAELGDGVDDGAGEVD